MSASVIDLLGRDERQVTDGVFTESRHRHRRGEQARLLFDPLFIGEFGPSTICSTKRSRRADLDRFSFPTSGCGDTGRPSSCSQFSIGEGIPAEVFTVSGERFCLGLAVRC